MIQAAQVRLHSPAGIDFLANAIVRAHDLNALQRGVRGSVRAHALRLSRRGNDRHYQQRQ